MAVVCLNKRHNSKQFFDLGVVPEYVYRSLLDSEKLEHEIFVKTFEPHYGEDCFHSGSITLVNPLKYRVTPICEYMPAKCGDKAETCEHRFLCWTVPYLEYDSKVTEEEIDASAYDD
jgi:hypothetical protein